MSRRDRAEQERLQLQQEKEQAEHNAIEAIKNYLLNDEFLKAEKAIEEVYRGFRRNEIPGEFLLHLGQGYCRQQKWAEAERILTEMQEKFPQFKKIPVTIVLAYISVENGRPRRAIRFLESLDELTLEHDYAQAYTEILKTAQQSILDGCVEIE